MSCPPTVTGVPWYVHACPPKYVSVILKVFFVRDRTNAVLAATAYAIKFSTLRGSQHIQTAVEKLPL